MRVHEILKTALSDAIDPKLTFRSGVDTTSECSSKAFESRKSLYCLFVNEQIPALTPRATRNAGNSYKG